MMKYDQSLLQSQSVSKLIELILALNLKLREYHNAVTSFYQDDPNVTESDIVEDEDFLDLQEQVKILKNAHHKALNSLIGFRGKTHYEQRQYMKSEVRRERYNRTD